jgi:hypothetical protein
MKLPRRVLGVGLLVLFCAAPCFPAGGETAGESPGEERQERAGESSGLIRAANVLYAQGAFQTRSQSHKALRFFVMVLLSISFLGMHRLLIWVIKNSFCHIFNFLRCLAVSLLLSGQAPPLYIP